MVIRLAIGADHAGQDLAKSLYNFSQEFQWWSVVQRGSSQTEFDQALDYPDRIPFVLHHVYNGYVGILICGTGVGMSISANRYPGIGAALCTDPEMARMARLHNNANVLILPGRLMSSEMAATCLSVFLRTPFEGGRHHRRIALFDPILANTVLGAVPSSPARNATMPLEAIPNQSALTQTPSTQFLAPVALESMDETIFSKTDTHLAPLPSLPPIGTTSLPHCAATSPTLTPTSDFPESFPFLTTLHSS
jgi:ribose 5-phosphate isomerase B